MKLLLNTIQRNPALLIEPSVAFAITLAITYLIRAIFFATVRKATARSQSRAGAILIQSLRGPTHIWNFILAVHFAIQASELPHKATAMAPQGPGGRRLFHHQPDDDVHALRRRDGAALWRASHQ